MGARDHTGLSRLAGADPVSRLRRRAAVIIWAERLADAAVPAALPVLIYLDLCLFGLGDARVWLLALLLAAALLGAGLWRLRWPRPADGDRRIEIVSGLRHRPLAAWDDRPETDDPAALLLWQAHRRRLAATLAGARAGGPGGILAARDPYALRAPALLLLLTGAIIAGADAPGRLAAGLRLPDWPFAGPRIDIWITPPDYAQAAPVSLHEGQTITALTGSRLTLIVNGPRRPPAISMAGTGFTITKLDTTSTRADATLRHTGRLRLGLWWDRLGAWTINIVPPGAPVISMLTASVTDGAHVTLRWRADDPYGLARFSACIGPVPYPAAAPFCAGLPLARGAGTAVFDLAGSPYYGLPIGIVFAAQNLAGVQTSARLGRVLVLPGLNLHDSTAIALDRLRQALAVQPRNAFPVARQLRNIALAPPSHISAAADVQLALLAETMRERRLSTLQALDVLLDLIREIEAGPDFKPQQAMASADAALLAALRHGLGGQPPAPAALQALLSSMQQALAQHLAARPGAAGGAGSSFDPAALNLLAQQIAGDEAAGKTAQAAAELQQLQAELNRLRTAQPMTAAQAAQAAAAAQAATALGRLTNAESDLLNATGQGRAQPADQAALRQSLSVLTKGLQKSGVGQLPGLAGAAAAMAQAQAALAAQDGMAAAGAEAGAIRNLQDAAAAIAAARRAALSVGTAQTGGGGETSGQGVNGAPDEDRINGWQQAPPDPAAAIEQMIIKQDAAPNLAPPTHQYLQRLLQPSPF